MNYSCFDSLNTIIMLYYTIGMCSMSLCTSLVQGKEYFKCPDNYGIFVRQSQIAVIEDTSSLPTPSRGSASRSSIGGASSIPLVSSLKKEKVMLIFILWQVCS